MYWIFVIIVWFCCVLLGCVNNSIILLVMLLYNFVVDVCVIVYVGFFLWVFGKEKYLVYVSEVNWSVLRMYGVKYVFLVWMIFIVKYG